MLFNGGKFGFVFHHAKVVALKIVVGNVVHTNLVVGVAEKSHKCFRVGVGELWRRWRPKTGWSKWRCFNILRREVFGTPLCSAGSSSPRAFRSCPIPRTPRWRRFRAAAAA